MKKRIKSNLKNYMDKEDVNIAQLSRKIDITENTIRGYVKNTFSRIDCEVALKLCDYFKAEIGEMFTIVDFIE